MGGVGCVVVGVGGRGGRLIGRLGLFQLRGELETPGEYVYEWTG